MVLKNDKEVWKSMTKLSKEELEQFEYSTKGRVRRVRSTNAKRCPQNHFITLPNVFEMASGYRYCLACRMARIRCGSSTTAEFYALADELYGQIMAGEI